MNREIVWSIHANKCPNWLWITESSGPEWKYTKFETNKIRHSYYIFGTNFLKLRVRDSRRAMCTGMRNEIQTACIDHSIRLRTMKIRSYFCFFGLFASSCAPWTSMLSHRVAEAIHSMLNTVVCIIGSLLLLLTIVRAQPWKKNDIWDRIGIHRIPLSF